MAILFKTNQSVIDLGSNPGRLDQVRLSNKHNNSARTARRTMVVSSQRPLG